MKFRPVQLVCFALLLCTLSVADAWALAPAQIEMQGSYLRALLDGSAWNGGGPQRAKSATRAALSASTGWSTGGRSLARSLPAKARVAAKAVWAMRPPSAQVAALQACTGFGRVAA